MKVVIIGCGLIGEKRAKVLGGHELIGVVDIDAARAKRIASLYGTSNTKIFSNWEEAVALSGADIVIVSTTNNLLTPIGVAAVRNGKHVLVEKPAARSSKELLQLIEASEKYGKIVKVGFSLRFHPAVVKAGEVIKSGAIGPLMFIRGRYGHGGRIGYDKEWRANPEISGGGELIDQGVHLIDLSRLFLGDFEHVDGFEHTYFWDMPVDDNAFLSLRTKQQQMAWLHVSCSEWKNMFCLEIYGRDGKLQIDGLGGSYGTEKLTFYKMLPQMGPPETSVFEFPGEDISWKEEFNHFVHCIEGGGELNGGLADAYEVLKVVDKIYGR